MNSVRILCRNMNIHQKKNIKSIIIKNIKSIQRIGKEKWRNASLSTIRLTVLFDFFIYLYHFDFNWPLKPKNSTLYNKTKLQTTKISQERSTLDLLPMQLNKVENPKQTKIIHVSGSTAMKQSCLMWPESVPQPGCNQARFTTQHSHHHKSSNGGISRPPREPLAKVSTKIEG